MERPIKLRGKQERFCQEYVLDRNGTQAAIRAGYSPRTANEQAAQILASISVQQRVQQLTRRSLEKLKRKLDITRERIITELARIAFADVRKVVEWGSSGVKLREGSSLADDDVAAVSEVVESRHKHGRTIRVKMHDKVKALELLAKHLGMFPQAPAAMSGDGEEKQIPVAVLVSVKAEAHANGADANQVRVIDPNCAGN